MKKNRALALLIVALVAVAAFVPQTRIADAIQFSNGTQLRSKTVQLTDAQIKALPTTPIELVAAPAAGYRIKPIGITISFSVVSATYTNINTTYSALQVCWDNCNGAWAASAVINDSTTGTPMTHLTTMLGGAVHDSSYDMPIPYLETDGTWWMPVNKTGLNGGQGNMGKQKNLAISIDNSGSGNLTAGNSSNYMKVIVYYFVEPT